MQPDRLAAFDDGRTPRDGSGGTPVTIVHGPRIETLTAARPDALAIADGRILAHGSEDALLLRFPRAEVRRVEGELIVPGFNDAHIHPWFAAETAARVDLSGTTTPDGAIAALRQAATKADDGEWVVAAGYSVPNDPSRRLDRTVLDQVSTNNPIYVIASNWHAAVVNSAGLRLLDREGVLGLPGGHADRDEHGDLDGWIYESVHMEAVWGATQRPPILPLLPRQVLADSLRRQLRLLNSHGTTSFTDALVTPAGLEAYDLLRRQHALTARVNVAVWHRYRDLVQGLGLSSGFGDEWLRLAGVKLMYDGAITGGTCMCADPYDSATGTGNGLQVLSREELTEIVTDLHAHGIRACVHANGDAAIDDVLTAVQSAQAEHPEIKLNHRIEHCSLLPDAQLAKVRNLGVTPVPFAGFIRYHGPALVARYTHDRVEQLARHGSLIAAGVHVAGSSDYPCAPISVLDGLESLTRRETADGRVIGAQERISLREALWVYTAGSAYATGEAHFKGRLTPGFAADFVVLDRDIFKAGTDWARQTSVLSTWTAGTPVWAAGDEGS
ncbi:amidohydrolase [Streptomyces sp. OE57]|uniref:amidohydrolase n=1 Tax=Streptomyces lacaronensis TaxID=3379885 RepID=UPI0039B76F0A